MNRNVFRNETKPGCQEVHPNQDPARGRLGLFVSSNHFLWSVVSLKSGDRRWLGANPAAKCHLRHTCHYFDLDWPPSGAELQKFEVWIPIIIESYFTLNGDTLRLLSSHYILWLSRMKKMTRGICLRERKGPTDGQYPTVADHWKRFYFSHYLHPDLSSPSWSWGCWWTSWCPPTTWTSGSWSRSPARSSRTWSLTRLLSRLERPSTLRTIWLQS